MERGMIVEKNYVKEIEEYYGEALDVISDFQDSGFWFSKPEDNRNFEDKIFLHFGKDIRMQLPRKFEHQLSNRQKNDIARDLLAYMVKKYKRGYTKRTITEVNEDYMEVIDEIFMDSIRENQNEILTLMRDKKCSFDEAVLQFYNEKTKQYFINHEQSGESRRDTKDPDER